MATAEPGFSEILGPILSGIGSIKSNEYNKDLKEAINQRGDLVRSLLLPIETPYLEGISPGGFLREAMAADGWTKAATERAKMEAEAKGHGTRTSTRGRRLMEGAGIAEALGGGYAEYGSDLGADTLLANNLLANMGYMPVEPYNNRYRFAGDLVEYLGEIGGDIFGDE